MKLLALKRKLPGTVWLALIACFHLSLFLTDYLQEDAFITFRTGFNLATNGEYSFNLGEAYPGATSLFYGHYTALLKLILGNHAITGIRVLNILFSIIAGFFLTESIFVCRSTSATRDSPEYYSLLFVSSCTPALITSGGSGMETPLLIFFMAAVLYCISRRYFWIGALLISVLPFVRMDAVAFCLIAAFVVFLFDKKSSLILLLGLIVGVILLVVMNIVVFGDVIPLTAKAKQVSYAPHRDWMSFYNNMRNTFLFNGYALGVSTKYIPRWLYCVVSIVLLFPSLLLLYKVFSEYFRQGREVILGAKKERSFISLADYCDNAPVLIMAMSAILIPVAYTYGGVIFPWYLWPFSVFVLVVFFAWLKKLKLTRAILLYVLFIFFTNILVILVHVNIASQEAGYRASIGKFLKSVSKSSDTLFLEPAGYIPFYSELTTWDTVGLASSKVLKYREKGSPKWWIMFVKKERPTFIIERSAVHNGGVVEGGDILSSVEREWFLENYTLIREFNYKEYLSKNRTVFTPLLQFGNASSYYAYKRID